MTSNEHVAWFRADSQDGVVIFKFTVPFLDRKMHSRLDYENAIDMAIAGGCRRIVLDFSDMKDTNHTWGLFQLIFIPNRELKQVGGQLAVCGMRGYLRRVFRFAELDRFVATFSSQQKAVAE